jgi:hypothetical protein
MSLVAWILALVGAGLALALSAGSAVGLVRPMDLYSAMAVMPLPTFAVYWSAPELYRALQAGTPLREMVFPGGPCVIGALTLIGIVLSLVRQDRRPGGYR